MTYAQMVRADPLNGNYNWLIEKSKRAAEKKAIEAEKRRKEKEAKKKSKSKKSDSSRGIYAYVPIFIFI
jgi:hypothetical protein